MGCRLWGRTESDTTEATQQQQQISEVSSFTETLTEVAPGSLSVSVFCSSRLHLAYVEAFNYLLLSESRHLHLEGADDSSAGMLSTVRVHTTCAHGLVDRVVRFFTRWDRFRFYLIKTKGDCKNISFPTRAFLSSQRERLRKRITKPGMAPVAPVP